MNKLKTFIGLLAILLFGMLLGSLLTWKFFPPPPSFRGPDHRDPHEMAAFFIDRLSDELNLTSDQKTALTPIATDCIKQIHEIHKQIDPQLTQLRTTTLIQIRAQLNQDQQKKFDQLVAEHNRKLMFLNSGTPPPPPANGNPPPQPPPPPPAN